MKANLGAIFFVVALEQASASTVVIDSFTEGSFALSFPSGPSGDASSISGPIGDQRSAGISNRNLVSGTTISSTLDTSSGGSLSFNADGTNTFGVPLSLNLRYTDGGPFSLLGQSEFVLDFSSLTGTGSLIVELGRSNTPGPSTLRVDLNSAGEVVVPFSQWNIESGETISDFSALHFTFEAVSEQFSFTLNEINAVPEPSGVLLLSLGGLVSVTRRKRTVTSSTPAP